MFDRFVAILCRGVLFFPTMILWSLLGALGASRHLGAASELSGASWVLLWQPSARFLQQDFLAWFLS